MDETDMTDKKLPSPEEIEKEFRDFVKGRFGENVQVFTSAMSPPGIEIEHKEEKEPKKEENKFQLDFNLKPKEIKKYLDRFVIKQDEAKKALAIAVCDHYNHVRECHFNPLTKELDYSKQNILILGPTGVGKTYLIRQIAKLIGVPFVKADATKFSETGYVGANVEDLIRDLVAQANGNIELAQYGIIYLDEADKLAAPQNLIGRDVSGRGVQIGLLKLMEETEVDLIAGHDVGSQLKVFMEFQKKGKIDKKVINTRHILFIISGAFNGMTELIKTRLNKNQIGFTSEANSPQTDEEYLKYAATKDFVDFGYEPEFIGRLPIRVACHSLSADDLYNILKNSEGSIIRQYEESFRAFGIKAVFPDETLQEIAKAAYAEETGARALMTVLEKILRDYKFELPSTPIQEIVITKEVIRDPVTELKRVLEDSKGNHLLFLQQRVRGFEKEFLTLYHMKIIFDNEATEMICTRALSEDRSPEELCTVLLQSYEHGLKLIQQNTGQAEFFLDKEVVQNPRAVLERWIKDSYNRNNLII